MTAFEPTTEQLEIRDFAELGLLVTAPAGCGKTEVLAMRVAGIIHRGGASPPRRILVLTFTNKARDNIRSRLVSHVGPQEMRRCVTVSNLHGFASRIVQAHGDRIGVDDEWSWPHGDWMKALCEELAWPWQRTNDALGILAEAKRHRLGDADVISRLEGAGAADALEIERERQQRKQLTYDDLIRHADVLLALPPVARLYQQHFASVVVDEYQDLTLQQLRMVQAVGYQRTTYAGDLAQGIFSFAGADPPAVFSSIKSEVPTELPLTESRRSSPAVLEALNALRGRTGGTHLTSADPGSWPGGGLVTASSFATPEAEAEAVLRIATGILDRVPNHRVAILARTGSRRRWVDDAVSGATGFDVHRWDDPLLDRDAAAIVGDALERVPAPRLSRAADAEELLRSVTDLSAIGDPDTLRAVVEAFSWVGEELAAATSLDEIKRRIGTSRRSAALERPGLHLLNAHLGKGQQFDWVIVIGLEDGSLPFFKEKTAKAIAEEARVFAVMMSRARHGVFLTFAKAISYRPGSSFAKVASPFLRDLVDAGVVSTSEQATAWVADVSWEAVASH